MVENSHCTVKSSIYELLKYIGLVFIIPEKFISTMYKIIRTLIWKGKEKTKIKEISFT